MVRRLWLFGLILGVPLIGVLASSGVQWKFNSELRAAAKQQAPDADPAREMPHPTDSHPPLSVRLRALDLTLASLVRDSLVVEPDEAAINLLDEPERLEEEVNDAYHTVLQRYLPPQPEQAQPRAIA